jgi:hypothetical protein
LHNSKLILFQFYSKMKYHRFITFFGFFTLILFSNSCSSDLDFNQINDAKLELTYIANLSYFDVQAKDFIMNGQEQAIAFDAQNFDVFKDKYFKSYLRKADFFFEVENTIARSFSIDIILFDQNDKVLYVKRLIIPAYTGTKNIVSTTDIFENTKLDLLKQTTRLGFGLVKNPGTPLTVNTSGNLKLRSSATVYLVIQ